LKERLRNLVKHHRLLLVIALAILSCSRKCNEAIWRPIRPLVLRNYLKSHEVRKLHIGAGSKVLPGWLNTDRSSSLRGIVFLDATRRFPLRDASIDYIYSHHVIEHLTYQQGHSMLRECFRVLKPGGSIRTATPDLETLARLYTPEKNSLQQRYIHWVVEKFNPRIHVYSECVVLNSAFTNFDHQFVYDYTMLETTLEKAGFAAIARCGVGKSDNEVFRGIEGRPAGDDEEDEEMMRFETMAVEATRPPCSTS
jgi:predicted SAM-dependent methyltransferase